MFRVAIPTAIAPEVSLADLAVLRALPHPLVAFLAGDLFRCSSYSFVIIAANSSLLAINLDGGHRRLNVLINSQLLELGHKVGLGELVILDVGEATAI